MRHVLTALASCAIGAALAFWCAQPVPLAERVKLSANGAVLHRKQAMVDCMAYTAGKIVGLERADRETDEACESLASDFVSTMQPPPTPEPATTAEEGISL
jgi:hypothetical protein